MQGYAAPIITLCEIPGNRAIDKHRIAVEIALYPAAVPDRDILLDEASYEG